MVNVGNSSGESIASNGLVQRKGRNAEFVLRTDERTLEKRPIRGETATLHRGRTYYESK